MPTCNYCHGTNHDQSICPSKIYPKPGAVCERCKGSGHIRPDCLKVLREYNLCFHCGDKHKSTDCPNKNSINPNILNKYNKDTDALIKDMANTMESMGRKLQLTANTAIAVLDDTKDLTHKITFNRTTQCHEIYKKTDQRMELMNPVEVSLLLSRIMEEQRCGGSPLEVRCV